MDTSRSSTSTRNPCGMAHTAEQFANVRRTPRSDVGESELVESASSARARRRSAAGPGARGSTPGRRPRGRRGGAGAGRLRGCCGRRRGRGGRAGRGGVRRCRSPERRIRPPDRGRGRGGGSRRGGRAHRRIEGGDGEEEEVRVREREVGWGRDFALS
jgi:hypothetical protein